MLISRVSEDGEGRPTAAPLDHSHEYQTASELFDLMAKNHPFDSDVGETLSTRDLVILYKNMDLGTKLMSNAEEFKRRPNQHVESVVYNDEPDSEGSDVSEIYGTDDLHNVYSINNERLDLFNSRPSLENILCQKLGGLEIQTSNISMEYDHHFLFKDPYIKEQLKNLNRMSGECDGMALPASLLDYICCKRLEDNYNFYMDNIIRYVKHTIEQLKRISNGDYLTDKAKEKWREVENASKNDDENTKILATSTSIPLQVERKLNGHSTTWDDIIHSEVDVRSLSKILEKKIIVEVPKLICGSYKLFSKFCSDNLIISCKREEDIAVAEMKKEPRVDVVLQLERSESGQVMSNISSMIIVQATPPNQLDERPNPLPLLMMENEEDLPPKENNELVYIENEQVKVTNKTVKIIEIPETKIINDDVVDDENEIDDSNDTTVDTIKDDIQVMDTSVSDTHYFNPKSNSALESGDSSVALRDILDTRAIPDILRKEAPFNFISPDDLSLSMHKLNMSSLPEESGEDMPQNTVHKKKSNTKVRIKSPYENKSYIMEEKKRKKLLEIREKREKKKMAVGENCKVTKHRYGKGAIMPQASSSVTRLSITNKSFYNSIYGQNMNIDSKSIMSKGRKSKRDLAIDASLEHLEGEQEPPMPSPEKNSLKYNINRSYYLDEAVTEMMYTQLRESECSSVREIFSASASAVSGEFSGKRNKIEPPEPDLNDQPADDTHCDSENEKKDSFDGELINRLSGKTESRTKVVKSSRSILNVPSNSPKDNDCNEEETPKKTVPTIECRKSIDKLYTLMKKLGKNDSLEIKSSRSKLISNINRTDANVDQGSSTIQASDSGTSLKHHLTSSNPSSFSFEKIQNSEAIPTFKLNNKKTDALTTVVSKVIISTKQQTVKVEVEKAKKDRKRVAINTLTKVPDNPLMAISQLLHEFDSVQKTRQRPPSDPKPYRKPDTPFEGRGVPRQNSTNKRRSRIDQPAQENEISVDKNIKSIILRDRRLRPNLTTESLKIPHHQISIEEKLLDRIAKEERQSDRATKEGKHVERFTKKKIADILDEVKEAKGEAVRGPSKLHSRLNSLAQPKKSYVQAHSEEYQTKYGKNLMADRLQRLASVPLASDRMPGVAAKSRPKRTNTEASSAVSVRPPPSPQPLERGLRLRRSASSSPEPRPLPAPSAPSAPCRQGRATDAPDIMKNKMVAVESYVKSHYGRASPPALGELNGAHTARVPLVPNDLDLASEPSSPTADESTAIGSKLHRIIDGMINAKPAPLAALPESRESSLLSARLWARSPPSPSAHSAPPSPQRDLSLGDGFSHSPSSDDFDYQADIFEDKNVKTAVESFQDKHDDSDVASENSETKCDRESNNSTTVLQKLEDALCGRMTMGTFPKRRRMKHIPPTPKQSMQRVLVVQSGDAGSLVLKSTMSRSLKLCTSKSDVKADLKTLPTFEKPQLDWNIPMQIATVGYAFPEYDAPYCGPTSAIRSLENVFKLELSVSSISTKGNKKSDKTSQCFLGSQSKHDTRDKTVLSMNNQEEIPVSSKKQMCSASVATEAPYFNNIEKPCGDCTNMLKNKSQTESKELKLKGETETVDCTSSLDMLVGLLNEIQKITTCHITDTVQYADKRECGTFLDVVNNATSKATVKNKNSHKLVSIASLDKLKKFESSPSIYSMYLSDGDKESIKKKIVIPRLTKRITNVLCAAPSHVDKEVGADLPVREYINTFTEVSSTFFPITITHSTNVTSSIIGILSKPSSQSIISHIDYETTYSDCTFNFKKKVMEIEEEENVIQRPVVEYTEIDKKIESCCEVVIENKIMSTEVHKVKREINLFGKQSKFYRKTADLDPLFKIKRDILVTMYSMLVLTVFAALSFPEILYHV